MSRCCKTFAGRAAPQYASLKNDATRAPQSDEGEKEDSQEGGFSFDMELLEGLDVNNQAKGFQPPTRGQGGRFLRKPGGRGAPGAGMREVPP